MPRRADTPQRSVELERSKAPLVLAALIVFGLAATAGAIMWGTSDAGQINVSATIANSQSRGAEGETGLPVETATEAQRTLPNGGLVPQDGTNPAPSPEPAPVAESASTTVSTTSSTTVDTQEEETSGESDAPSAE
jgi:hypothetical protein